MGYTTEFEGSISVDPPLSAEEIEFLTKFAGTRRMYRTKGPYFVHGSGYAGQGEDDDILNHNRPPAGQPELWCKWVPTEDGAAIEWSGEEKFYKSAEWMKYLIDHFIGSSPLAKSELPFLQGHVCNGYIDAQGEETSDRWRLFVVNNVVSHSRGTLVYGAVEPV